MTKSFVTNVEYFVFMTFTLVLITRFTLYPLCMRVLDIIERSVKNRLPMHDKSVTNDQSTNVLHALTYTTCVTITPLQVNLNYNENIITTDELSPLANSSCNYASEWLGN